MREDVRRYTSLDFLRFLGRLQTPEGGPPDRGLKPIVKGKTEQQELNEKKAECDAWLATKPHTSYCLCIACRPRARAYIPSSLEGTCACCGLKDCTGRKKE